MNEDKLETSSVYGSSGSEHARRKAVASLLSTAAVVGSMCNDGPYSDLGFHIPKGKSTRRGYAVACHVCGDYGRVTLYKDGDQYICKKCRDKKLEETDKQ